MILLDTSAVIASFGAERTAYPLLLKMLAHDEPVVLCSVVLYEWLRGPRTAMEIDAQERVLSSDEALPFALSEAALAADIYRSVKRAGNREVDIMIAATAIYHKARLWTLNTGDFADIPGLQLYKPR
jgi:predicted nucleic acid-binding protein